MAVSRAPRRRVYPRVCGGTSASWAILSMMLGLSPRVRGNHDVVVGRVVAVGSIPACAGEPNSLAATSSISRVYPRVCGGTQSQPMLSV